MIRRLNAFLAARSPRQLLGLAAVTGGIGALGLAPFNLPAVASLGFLALSFLLITVETPRRGFWTGIAGGTGYFIVALNWIVEPFLVDVARHAWMSPFAILFLASGLALFWGAAAAGAVWLARAPLPRMLAWAAGLSLAEYLRATVLTGFPWAHPGHIWIDTPLLPLAAYVGPHGLTALTLLVCALTAALIWTRTWWALLPPMAVVPALALALSLPAAPAPGPDAPMIRLVQPNAPQHLKWREEMIPVFFRRALDLTEAPPAEGAAAPDLVIWPETSLQVLLSYSELWRAEIGRASGDAPAIVGTQRFVDHRARNSLVELDPDGAIVQIYDKHHLVPFGEYLPLSGLMAQAGLGGLAETLYGGYSSGPGAEILDLGPLGRVFPMICYETIFPGYIRQVERPDWQLQITNDAWFGGFSGPYQHLALARLRAAEQGIPLLRAANTGVSAVIDARGVVLATLPLGEAGALDTRLPPALPATLYAQTGDLPVIMLLMGLLAGFLLRRMRGGH